MSRVIVSYLGLRVGVLAEARGGIFFEYDREFIASGHELSPLNLPLGPGVRARSPAPAMRLPGLFDDSLPDLWGRRLMEEWFRRRGISAPALDPLQMLSYVGRRGMGALVYAPELEVEGPSGELTLVELHEAATQAENQGPIDLQVLAQVGSSAGGARPKALLGLHRTEATAPILAGADELPPEYESWLVKFDTSREATLGPMEEAYARMAQSAGLDLPESRLLETRHADGVRRHFAVRRFDRSGTQRIHHHTLAAMCHQEAGDLDYEILLRVTRRITHDEREVWKAFRRAAFNVIASNRDDHGKNHGFLYQDRRWRLGPAYDLTFTSPRQVPERGLALCGERRNAGAEHLLKLAEREALDRKTAIHVIDEVRAACARWREFADAAGLPPASAAEIATALAPRAGGSS